MTILLYFNYIQSLKHVREEIKIENAENKQLPSLCLQNKT